MPGFKPYLLDSGPQTASTGKQIQLMQNTPKNKRVQSLMFTANLSITTPAMMQGTVTLAILAAICNSLVSSAILTINGKTLWTLTGYQLFQLAMYKSRNVPSMMFINNNGDLFVPAASTTYTAKLAIPFYFNQPTNQFPSLLCPGVAQLFNANLQWNRGAAVANLSGGGALSAYTLTNVNLLAILGFEEGYYCAPMAFIDIPTLALKTTPISGGYIPNVLNTTPATTSATGIIVSYSTPYGEEIHGVLPDESTVNFAENGQTIYDTPEEFFVSYKFQPLNASLDEMRPSPNGEALEVTTPQAGETIIVERYIPTDQFIGAITANLGDVIKDKTWDNAPLPGSAAARIPTEFLPYMPKRLVG